VNEPTPHSSPPLTLLIVLLASLLLALGVPTFLGSLGFAGVIILAAVLIAYLIFPAVQLFKRFIPAIVAIAITYLIFVALVAAVIFIVVPPVIDPARDLIVSLPGLVRRLTAAIANPDNRLFSKLPGDVRSYDVGLPDQAVQFLSTHGNVVVQRTFNVLFSTVSRALSLIIVPILAAYLLFDTTEMKRAALGFVPERVEGYGDDAEDCIDDLGRKGIVVGNNEGQRQRRAPRMPASLTIGFQLRSLIPKIGSLT